MLGLSNEIIIATAIASLLIEVMRVSLLRTCLEHERRRCWCAVSFAVRVFDRELNFTCFQFFRQPHDSASPEYEEKSPGESAFCFTPSCDTSTLKSDSGRIIGASREPKPSMSTSITCPGTALSNGLMPPTVKEVCCARTVSEVVTTSSKRRLRELRRILKPQRDPPSRYCEAFLR